MAAPRSVHSMPGLGAMSVGGFARPLGNGRFSGLGALGFDLPGFPNPGDILTDAEKAANAAKQQAQDQADKVIQQGKDAANQAQQAIQSVQDLIAHPDKLVKSFAMYTTHLPDIVIDDPLKPSPPGIGSQIAPALKPKLVITLNPIAGQQIKPITYAPYGDPGPSDWETYALVGVAVASVGVAVLGLGAASFIKGRKGGLLRRWLASRKAKRSGAVAGLGFDRSRRRRAA